MLLTRKHDEIMDETSVHQIALGLVRVSRNIPIPGTSANVHQSVLSYSAASGASCSKDFRTVSFTAAKWRHSISVIAANITCFLTPAGGWTCCFSIAILCTPPDVVVKKAAAALRTIIQLEQTKPNLYH